MDSKNTPVLDHRAILEAAMSDPRHTTVTLPKSDINERLATQYTTDKPTKMTRTQLWDMEIRKAKNPQMYLGPVLKQGSQRVFPSTRHGALEDFVRVAQHRPWQDPSGWNTVIESVRLDHERQDAIFVGLSEFVTPDGETITTEKVQPLFHVHHGVEGTEDEPLNTWSITHLTEKPDEGLLKIFEGPAKSPYLSPFVEVYVREVMGVELKRKE